MCRLVTKQRLSDFQMTCLSSQSLLNSNVSWHCFATIQNIFAKFKKFIKELFSVMQSIHVKFLFSINYFLCISYFVTVLENKRASHNFSSLCHLLSSIMSREKYSVFGKYLYCANVKIFRSGITPGLGPDTHPPAINIRGEAHVFFFMSFWFIYNMYTQPQLGHWSWSLTTELCTAEYSTDGQSSVIQEIIK